MAHSHRREYWIIFTWLFVLTVLEVGLVYVPGISKALLISGLIMMALVKAALVGFFFMHLKSETVFLKFTVVVPMVFPALYAVVLITEAAWRYLS
jgi:cytochrome c oxidase subunit 4